MQAIAEQLGYAASGNFSRFFQRRFGCTRGIGADWLSPPDSALRRNLSAFFSLVNPLFGQ